MDIKEQIQNKIIEEEKNIVRKDGSITKTDGNHVRINIDSSYGYINKTIEELEKKVIRDLVKKEVAKNCSRKITISDMKENDIYNIDIKEEFIIDNEIYIIIEWSSIRQEQPKRKWKNKTEYPKLYKITFILVPKKFWI